MKDIKVFFTALFIFALLAAWTPKANAADTSDVIAGIILGGIIGSEIQKSNRQQPLSVYNFPNGTLVIPTPKVDGKTCWIRLDKDGYPTSLKPQCWGYNPGDGRYSKHESAEDAFRRNYPCGGQWGFGCRKLIEKLK